MFGCYSCLTAKLYACLHLDIRVSQPIMILLTDIYTQLDEGRMLKGSFFKFYYYIYL